MKRYKLVIFILLVFCLLNSTIYAEKRPKLLIVLINHVDWNDLTQSRAPHIQQLIKNGAVGLLNTKTLSKYNTSGSYLTVGMSCRVKVDGNMGLAFNISEVKNHPSRLNYLNNNNNITGTLHYQGINVSTIAQLRTQVKRTDPNFNPGLLGQVLKDHGIKVALFGNADTSSQMHREAALMLMDEKGWIPNGNISKDVLRKDPSGKLSYRTDYHKLFSDIMTVSNQMDLIVVETGDTSRLEYDVTAPDATLKKKIIEEIDRFIGKVLPKIQPENLLIFGATSNSDMIKKGNTGLTPILLYGKGKGLLTSTSTHRTGYVTNLDLATLICWLTGVKVPQNRLGKGSLIRVKPSLLQLNGLKKETVYFSNLRLVRYPFINGIIALYFIGVFAGLIIINNQSVRQFTSHYLFGLIALLLMPLGVLAGGTFGYSPIWLPLGIFLGVPVIGAFILLKGFSFLRALVVPLILVPIILIVDVYSGSQLMIRSVMGSDLIAGGRFYGIGNDWMGVIIGSLTAGIGLIIQTYPGLRLTARWWVSILLLLAVTGIGIPSFGANVGGMLTAMITLIVTIMVLNDIKLSIFKWLGVFFIVTALVVIIACCDAFFNPWPSHIGRTILSLINQGSIGFFQIIKVKLSILGGTIIGSWWSLLLLCELIALCYVKKHIPSFIMLLKQEYPFWWMMMTPLGAGCVCAFVFNDTGIIPATLILTYFWLLGCGLYLYHYRNSHSEQNRKENKGSFCLPSVDL